MKRPDTPWARFANQFRRQRLPSNVDEDDGKLEWEMDDAAKSETAKVHEAWDRTRELVTRGNAAGAVASLTLFGSQQLGDRDPHLSVFLTLCLFITESRCFAAPPARCDLAPSLSEEGKDTCGGGCLGRVQSTSVHNEPCPDNGLDINYSNDHGHFFRPLCSFWANIAEGVGRAS